MSAGGCEILSRSRRRSYLSFERVSPRSGIANNFKKGPKLGTILFFLIILGIILVYFSYRPFFFPTTKLREEVFWELRIAGLDEETAKEIVNDADLLRKYISLKKELVSKGLSRKSAILQSAVEIRNIIAEKY